MDDKWFKRRQKEVGVTAEDIAQEMGRTRSNVSHIYSGQQKMSLDWARAFAKVLKVPLDEVLTHAGVSNPEEAQTLQPGFSDNDAAPFVGSTGASQAINEKAALFGGKRPGVDVWSVKSDALSLKGYLPGDYLLVDVNQSELCKAGDTVIAQIYNWQSGTAETVLRTYQPPVLIACTTNPEIQGVHVVDGNNVAIKGKVIASWRES